MLLLPTWRRFATLWYDGWCRTTWCRFVVPKDFGNYFITRTGSLSQQNSFRGLSGTFLFALLLLSPDILSFNHFIPLQQMLIPSISREITYSSLEPSHLLEPTLWPCEVEADCCSWFHTHPICNCQPWLRNLPTDIGTKIWNSGIGYQNRRTTGGSTSSNAWSYLDLNR